jgi:hypothetical protein
MGALKKMFSGTQERQGMIRAETDAAKKRSELALDSEADAAMRAKDKMKSQARSRGGAASTRLSSDTILGGAAPLG